MATITSAQVGTNVATGAGSLTALAMTMPINANVDNRTPLVLTDGNGGRVLYSAYVSDLASFFFAVKPNHPLGTGAPTPPPYGTMMLAGTNAIPFTSGLFVKSCPANAPFTSTP
jgi:hypothetical protein